MSMVMYQLPYELILQILRCVDDIHTLKAIVFSSKEIYGVFAQNKDELITNALSIDKAFLYSIKEKYMTGIKKYNNISIAVKNKAMRYSAKINDLTMVKHLADDLGANNFIDALQWSARYGHAKIVEYIVERVNADNLDINDAIRIAIKNGFLEIVKYLLHTGDELNIYLWSSVKYGHLEIIKYLLDIGARDINGALRISVENGNLDIIQLLLERGANDFSYALQLSASYNHIDIVRFLIDHSISHNIRLDYYNALELSAKNGHINIVKLLLPFIMNNNPIIIKINNILHLCAENGNLDSIKCIVDKFTINELNIDWILRSSIMVGHIDIVKYIINDLGINIGYFDINDILKLAAENNHHEIVTFLIDAGAGGIDEVLQNSIEDGHIEVVKCIIKKCMSDFDIDIEYALKSSIMEKYPEITAYIESVIKK
jgi:ankyrin repeat protein